MRKKHFNIPVFIPELACPFQCIFCDQSKIAGIEKLPNDMEILEKIETYLQTMPGDSEVQLAYFGGNFTGIPTDRQEHFLKLVSPFIEQGRISGIRLSTRPDYINDEVLSILKKNHVTSIELGAQSFDEDVLRKSRRGHTAVITETASKMILEHGFSLGLQMMVGLPGDSPESSMYTARKIVQLGAADTRIYPTLVIKGTRMERMYREKKYRPLDLSEAVERCADLIPVFEDAGVNILKVGLHPSDGLLSGEELVAGPFHQSFRELVETHIWKKRLEHLTLQPGEGIEIKVGPGQINHAIGHRSANRKMLEKVFKNVVFSTSEFLTGREFQVQPLK